jgi:hypothetical protein
VSLQPVHLDLGTLLRTVEGDLSRVGWEVEDCTTPLQWAWAIWVIAQFILELDGSGWEHLSIGLTELSSVGVNTDQVALVFPGCWPWGTTT